MESELEQPTKKPDPINVIVTNHSSCQIVILGRRTYRIDGVFTIEVFIGEPGQNLQLIGEHNEWGNKVIQDEEMIPRPVA